MKLKLLCLIILSFPAYTTSFVDVNVITSYLKAKTLNVGFFIGCLKKKENVKDFKLLNTGDKRIKFIHPGNLRIKESHGHFAVIFDADCKGSLEVLIKSGNDKLFRGIYHWLILSNESNFSLNLNKVDLNIDSDVHVLRPENYSKNYIVEDVYNPSYSKGGELKVRPIGRYDEMNGYKIRVEPCFFCSRRNMTGITFNTKIIGPQDFQGSIAEYLDNFNSDRFHLFSVVMYHLLKNCQHYYNFKFEIAMTNSTGYIQANKKFDGLVADLQSKAIDYGSTPLFPRNDRFGIVRFGRMVWPFKVVFIFRDMNPRYRPDAFFKPLSSGVWICTLFISAVIIAFLRITSRFEKMTVSEGIDYSWSVHTVITVGAFCQQGISAATNLLSGRITHLFLLIVTLLLYQFYSASLVSSLLMKPPTRIKNVRDLVDSGMKAGCEDIFYTRAYFAFTSDPASKELYAKQIVAKNFSTYMNVTAGLALVAKGGFAYHVEPVTAYPIIKRTFPESAICELGEVIMISPKSAHVGYQKDSPFKDMFDTCLQGVVEYGIMDRDMKFWLPRKPECLHAGQAQAVSVNLEHFYPLLYFLGFGMLLSLILLVLENIYFRWEKIYTAIKLRTGH